MTIRADDALWADRPLPEALPALSVRPDAMQLFMFSATTWNRHHVHYSRAAAQAEGLPDVVVHRGLIGAFLSRMLSEWLAGRGELCALSWKVTGSAVPGEPLHCRGQIVARRVLEGRVRLECEVSAVDDHERIIATGAASVQQHAGTAP